MQLPTIDFLRHRRAAALISVVLVLASLGTFFVKGLHYSLEFTGGTLVELEFSQPADPATLRRALDDAGFASALVQNYGSERELMVRLPPQTADQGDLAARITALLAADDPGARVVRMEFVGPAIGGELREQGGLALVIALLVVSGYIMIRFTPRFSAGAVIALVHDAVITVGAFAIFRWEFNLAAFAALLAVIGYSINDTIVIFDRIRENFRQMRRATPFEVINASINQTLERTLLTALTTLLVLVALRLFGGETLEGFANALIIGIVVGTYSSVYIASYVLLALGTTRADFVTAEEQAASAEADGQP